MGQRKSVQYAYISTCNTSTLIASKARVTVKHISFKILSDFSNFKLMKKPKSKSFCNNFTAHIEMSTDSTKCRYI